MLNIIISRWKAYINGIYRHDMDKPTKRETLRTTVFSVLDSLFLFSCPTRGFFKFIAKAVSLLSQLTSQEFSR